MPCCEERRLGFGELRMDDQWLFGTECARDKSKSLGASRSREYLIDADSVLVLRNEAEVGGGGMPPALSEYTNALLVLLSPVAVAVTR